MRNLFVAECCESSVEEQESLFQTEREREKAGDYSIKKEKEEKGHAMRVLS